MAYRGRAVKIDTNIQKLIAARRIEIATSPPTFRSRIAAGNDPRTLAVIDAVVRIEPAGRLIRGAADNQIDGPCDYFVVRVGSYDFERERITIRHGIAKPKHPPSAFLLELTRN